MDFTIEVCKAFGLSPFDVLQKDKDHVIMLINYFVEKGQETEIDKPSHKKPKSNDGFWDF